MIKKKQCLGKLSRIGGGSECGPILLQAGLGSAVVRAGTGAAPTTFWQWTVQQFGPVAPVRGLAKQWSAEPGASDVRCTSWTAVNVCRLTCTYLHR